jgi:uncharacterized protein (TIRG00374 family)
MGFLYQQNILKFDFLMSVFQENKKLIFFIAFLQILNCLFMSIRYYFLARIFCLKITFKTAIFTTFISNGIGQWLPGSLGAIELIRVILMRRSKFFLEKKEENLNTSFHAFDFTSRVAVVSLIDRLIGLLVMLFLGILAIFYFNFNFQKQNDEIFKNLNLLLLFSFSAFFFIIFCMFFVKFKFFKKFINKLEKLFYKKFKSEISQKIFYKIFSFFHILSLGDQNFFIFWKPICCSFVSIFLFSLGTYFSAIALSAQIPFEAILATVSLLSLASLLPLGLGGLGGLQIVAMFVFSFFQVSSQVATSAQFLQTIINLLTLSFFVFLFLPQLFKESRRLEEQKIHN